MAGGRGDFLEEGLGISAVSLQTVNLYSKAPLMSCLFRDFASQTFLPIFVMNQRSTGRFFQKEKTTTKLLLSHAGQNHPLTEMVVKQAIKFWIMIGSGYVFPWMCFLRWLKINCSVLARISQINIDFLPITMR